MTVRPAAEKSVLGNANCKRASSKAVKNLAYFRQITMFFIPHDFYILKCFYIKHNYQFNGVTALKFNLVHEHQRRVKNKFWDLWISTGFSVILSLFYSFSGFYNRVGFIFGGFKPGKLP